jgi:acylphosphatase
MDTALLHVLVTGRVQGVGFRWFLAERARALGLRGWVRNLEDGTVEVMAAGPPGELSKLRVSLREGPPRACVEAVVDLPADGSSIGHSFEIRRDHS